MKVEIWSDVMCPFCYIGKRRFEKALARVDFKDEVEVIWKSFQLDPDARTQPGKSVNSWLAERKGWPLEHARQMNARVTEMAAAEGLVYDFDKAVIANSLDAHRLSHLAARYNLGDAMEERLFRAYFTEGKDTSDHDTLVQLGTELGMEEKAIREMLESGSLTDEVYKDVEEAEALGIRGVPFFVMNRRYAVSGAQDVEVFIQSLEAAHKEEA